MAQMCDSAGGLRDFEAIEALANTALILKNDHAMPANNRLLIFKKIASFLSW